MQQNLVVGEILKDEDDIPASLTNFTTRFNIRENTEQVLVNGILQAFGPKDYTISDSYNSFYRKC